MKKYILITYLTSFCLCAYCQVKITIPQSAPVDTSKTEQKKTDPRSPIKPYNKVINKLFITKKGLFTVHQHKDTIYFEVPDSLLGRDVEVINRLENGPAGTGIYAGEQLDERTIRFEKHPADSTIVIRNVFVVSQADSTSDIFKAVSSSTLDPVAISFPIKAYGENHHSYVIDVGTYIKAGIGLFNSVNEHNNLTRFMDPKDVKDVFLESVHAYPINVEVSISKTGRLIKKLLDNPSGNPVSLITHTSFIELPKVPLQQRIRDERIGLFADQVYNFADDQQKVEDRKFILRWRIEPKSEDIFKWKKGELVEPRKPIVIYIDPATPKQWRPYLIAGINDWQKAFEQAGFKNAIIGKEWPESDTTMHMDDARYSFINYLPSEIENAYGPQVHDPRSGEIIQTHIGWYHNVMQYVHDMYMIEAGAVDPRARHAKFDDELMGQLIRFVSSHEVGHTLGLRHNMGSSSRTPVDSLRSKTYLEKHGHTASIMDYARFDYVAQPEDHIPENDLFPKIGEYDRWAIEWAYKNSNATNSEDDKKVMWQLTTDSLKKNPRLWFGVDNREVIDQKGNEKSDPRSQTEDLGDNAMRASTYGIKNLQRILPNLPEWTHEQNGTYENLESAYDFLKDQYFRYMQHVMMNIGGVYTTPRSEDDHKPVYEPTPKAMQQEAVQFFNRELFVTPYWLLNKDVMEKVAEPQQPNFIEDLQAQALNKLLSVIKIDQLLANQREFGEKAYPFDEYMADIHRGIWKELKAAHPVTDNYRRSLQKNYVDALNEILLSPSDTYTETDAFSIIRADFLLLQKEVNAAIPKTTDKLTRYHLEDIKVRIGRTLEAKQVAQ